MSMDRVVDTVLSSFNTIFFRNDTGPIITDAHDKKHSMNIVYSLDPGVIPFFVPLWLRVRMS
jgi:hypothetical protein